MKKDKIKVILLYRVLQHWRTPIFEQLGSNENLDFNVFYGPDFKSSKVISYPNPVRFKNKKFWAYQFRMKGNFDEVLMPISPGIFFSLIRSAPDVVITEGTSNLFNALIGFIYCKLFGKKFIWWSLGKIHGTHYTGFRSVLEKFIQYIEKRSDAIITYSNLGKDYFLSVGIEETKIFVAVNVVDTELKLKEIAQLDQEQLYKESHENTKFIVLFVGALDPQKRVEVLLDAYELLEKKYSNSVKLIIVGEGKSKKSLEKMVGEKGLLNVKFTGRVFDGVNKYFLGSDVFVMPGLGGLAVSDAMIHGLPVISSIGDGCERDLIEEGKSGFIIENMQKNELFEKLEYLYTNDVYLSKMKQTAFDRVKNKFSVNVYLQNVLKAIYSTSAIR